MEAGGFAQISDCYVHNVIYLLLLLYCGTLVGCPDVSKSKTLKKFKSLGDVLDCVTPIIVYHIEVPSFGCFYNLAQILI